MRENKNTIIFVYGLSLLALGYFGFVWFQHVLREPDNVMAKFGFATIIIIAVYVVFRFFKALNPDGSEK